MSKIVRDEEYEIIEDKTKLLPIKVEDEMKKSFIAYAMAVNVSRAIPDVRDGLKPVHRRILYAMNELGLTNDKPFRKCARIVGDVLGKYHPHGDSAVYDALVRLAQDFSIRRILVEGQGNFGSVDGDPPAAQRYTEARLAKIAAEMLRDIDKKTVDFYPNFDNTLEQPVVLPCRFPNLLVNGSDGIAVGMATSIPPHNLGEVINATLALLDNPDLEVDDLLEYIPAPDYPTGALILGRAAIKQAYRTGHGSAILRARCDIEEQANGKSRILVSEIPYQVNKAKLIETIADMVKTKRIEGISDLRDESDRKGMRIVIELKRDVNPQVVLNQLYKHTKLQITNPIILLALCDGVPKVMNLKEILVAYIAHQREVIVRRTRFDLEKAEEKMHIQQGLVIALENIDEVVDIIKTSRDRVDAQNNLMERFSLSEKQSNAILEMRLSRLTSLEVAKIKEELINLELMIADLKDILARPERVDEIIRVEMTEIKDKYDDPRRSELSYDLSVEIDIEDLIDKEDVVVSLTHEGYIKRQPVSEYRAQRRGGKGVSAHKTKEEDFVERIFTTNTHDLLLFFTDKGKVYSTKCYEIPEGTKNGKGRPAINMLQLDSGEKIQAILPLADATEGYLVLATTKGLIKKTSLDEYKRINRNGKIAIKLLEGDSLVNAEITSGTDELLMATNGGKCIRFNEADVRDMGRTSQGVRSVKLADDERVVDMSVIREGYDVLTVTSNGYGKLTDISEYRLQSRAGKGVKAGNFTEKTGSLVSMKMVTADMDLMVITDTGIIIRTPIASISKISRGNTQGVKVMNVHDAKVQSVALAPHIDEEEDGETPTDADGAVQGTAAFDAAETTAAPAPAGIDSADSSTDTNE